MSEEKIYCIMRHQKYHLAKDSIKGLQGEQNREYRSKNDYNDIVHTEKSYQNKAFVFSSNFERDIYDVCKKYGVKIDEEKSVALIGTVYTASPEWFERFERDENGDYTEEAKRNIEKYFLDCIEYHKEKFGVVISAHVHYDQTTPHLQVYSVPVIRVPKLHNYYVLAEEIEQNNKKKLVPITDEDGNEVRISDKDCTEREYKRRLRDTKCKIKRREYVTDEDGNVVYHVSLGGARALGNRTQLSEDQTDFAERVGKKYDLERGEITMGTEQHKKHRTSLQHQLDKLHDNINKSQSTLASNTLTMLSSSTDLEMLQMQVENTQRQLKKSEEELEELEEKKKEHEDFEKELEAKKQEADSMMKEAEETKRQSEETRKETEEYVNRRRKEADDIVSSANDTSENIVSHMKDAADDYETMLREHLDKVYATENIANGIYRRFIESAGLLSAYEEYVRKEKEARVQEQMRAAEELRKRRVRDAERICVENTYEEDEVNNPDIILPKSLLRRIS